MINLLRSKVLTGLSPSLPRAQEILLRRGPQGVPCFPDSVSAAGLDIGRCCRSEAAITPDSPAASIVT
jgi:hypothetical protein